MKGRREKESIFKNLIFVALAASGKSEALTFIKMMPPEQRVRDLRIGREIVVLDDFPYVDMMKAIDKGMVEDLKLWPIFFAGPDKPFLEPAISWKLLILLLNQDYERIVSAQKKEEEEETVRHLLARIDAAREQLQAKPLFFNPDCEPLIGRINFSELCQSLKEKVSGLEQRRKVQMPKNLEETTILIEFARGGHFRAKPPLPYGYANSFSVLHPAILQQAAFLYLKVEPKQAREKNRRRFDPKNPILGHVVPSQVMLQDYGCDDFEYLLETSDHPGFIRVQTPNHQPFLVPAAILDNTQDLTTFVREYKNKDFGDWPPDKCQVLLSALKKVCQKL